ncbi:hypothetical protein [Paenibacillus sp. R14(2021)]|uniref:hypothetical protein n=1 Tax=Paenibacillus sp. R14(2021) TaxID=2859228 RepID=UPI001C6159DB|nr:hypothetical protein [Paenibacillus sp. R14(2021)]
MIQYGSDTITALRFLSFKPQMERRDTQWIDIELRPEIAAETPVPAEITDLTVLVICTHGGVIAQIVPHDEGTDCEFQFTFEEKEQIRSYIEQADMQAAIANLARN